MDTTQQIVITDLATQSEREVSPFRVITPDGEGTAIRQEIWGTQRIGILLDKNPYWYAPCYYFSHEIKMV